MLLAVCLALFAPVVRADISLSSLTVDHKHAPFGIDTTPRFSWLLIPGASDRGVSQLSYHLTVSASSSSTVLWDSGVVNSTRPYDAQYAGSNLTSATAYTWNVSVESTHGSASASSNFTTGLLSSADWGASTWIGAPNTTSATDALWASLQSSAHWIWTTEAGETPPNAPPGQRAFRLTVPLAAGANVTGANVIMTADDDFVLYVNGDELGSSPTTADSWKVAQSLSANASLFAGNASSAVFAVLANNTADVSTGGAGPAGLLGAIQLLLGNGENETFVTNSSWLAHAEPIPSDFASPSYNASGWNASLDLGAYGTDPWGTGVSVNATSPSSPGGIAPLPAPLLRRALNITSAVSSALLFVSAGGLARITLDGAPVSDDVLAPAFTDYDVRVQYATYDITDKVASGGEHVLGAELGRARYGTVQGDVWGWNTSPWHADPSLRLLLRITHEDGSTEDVVSDANWSVAADGGGTRWDDIFGGEVFDAREVRAGWDEVGFDGADVDWVNASVVPGPKGQLVAQSAQPIRVMEVFEPVNVTQPAEGIYVVAFPVVTSGWVALNVSGPAGTEITVNYGEKLYDNGTVQYQDTQGYYAERFQEDTFVLKGTGEREFWESRFSHKGYQFVQVSGWPNGSAPTAADIQGKAVHNDLDLVGSFNSSVELFNQIHEAVVRTLYNNFQGIPSDTPMYEKNGWTGDASVAAEMAITNIDMQAFHTKWLTDVSDSRGRTPNTTAPCQISPTNGWGADSVAPQWFSAYVLIPWWLYQYRGDVSILQTHYEGIRNYVEFELARSPGGVANSIYADWDTPETSPLGGNPPENSSVSATAYLYTMLNATAQMAAVLNKTDDLAQLEADAASVKNTFNTQWFNLTSGYYAALGDAGYRQTHNLLALAFGLVNDSNIQSVADSIATNVTALGTHLNTGALGTKHILTMLTEYGHADLAFKVATQTSFPSWGFWIENGATTMWEHWLQTARSHDHYFLGTIDDWFFKYIAGIKVTSPGFVNFTIAPQLTQYMDWANATTITPYGPLGVSWSKSASGVQIDVTVPPGTSADVVFPTNSTSSVSEAGRALIDLDELQQNAQQGGSARVLVQSGSYSFFVNL